MIGMIFAAIFAFWILAALGGLLVCCQNFAHAVAEWFAAWVERTLYGDKQ